MNTTGNKKPQHSLRIAILRLILLVLILSSCSSAIPTDTTATPAASPPKTDYFAQVNFSVELPANTVGSPGIFIDLLDEVTGLALNPTRYKMEQKATGKYSFQLPVPVGSLLKYRYIRDGNPTVNEVTATGTQVRYRLLLAQGPVEVQDRISGWPDLPYKGSVGRITGQVLDASTKAPIPSLTINIAGTQTISSADGTFLLEGLPTGIHNLVGYSLDGIYEPYQQGAQVAADTTTKAVLTLNPSQQVKVTFMAQPPGDSVKGIPIRMIGNILSMGNTFADLGGGVSTIASRSPLMILQPDGRYSLTMTLPVGLDLRYKYSAGDGFWNAEHTADGKFQVRHLVVPSTNITIEDQIETWQLKDSAPVTFTVTVPTNTPAADTVSIQFNPYGWTEPIPMWPLGNRKWLFVLYSPMQLANKISYRYCRNDQCGIADDASTSGDESRGRILTPTRLAQSMQDDVKQWAWLNPTAYTAGKPAGEATPRGAGFVAGIELNPAYRPSWQPHLSQSFDQIRTIGANWIIVDPTWSATRISPPVFEPLPGTDMLWQDLVQMMVWAQDRDLNIAMFPMLDLGAQPEQWWGNTAHDADWWQSWFDRYRSFILHYADLAAQVRAGALVLGDPAIAPAFPGAKLANGQSSNVPADADKRWKSLIAEVRTRYSGKIIWTLSYPVNMQNLPGVVSEADEIYLLWSAPGAKAANAASSAIITEFARLLDSDVQKVKEKYGKPLILGVNYPSVLGVSRGCAAAGTQCAAIKTENLNTPEKSSVDLQEQAAVINSLLVAVNQRKWIAGIVIRGFYPAAVLYDGSASISGKPAQDVISAWYPRILAPVK